MHGAGNDFIVADNSSGNWPSDVRFISGICSRNRGVGADGLILLEGKGPFKMSFFNCDGSAASMCGNGLRCAALFTWKHMKSGRRITFKTGAGTLHAEITGQECARIEIPVAGEFKKAELDGRTLFFGNTGVPHAVVRVKDVKAVDVVKKGRTLRNHAFFAPAGTNVNFISMPDTDEGPFRIRTYERGVEGETSACGTGIAASSVVLMSFFGIRPPVRFLTAESDLLTVDLQDRTNIFPISKVSLEGPAVEAFTGTYETQIF